MINVTVDELNTKESTTLSYNIEVFIISSDANVQRLGNKKFTTLMEDYQPENTQVNLLDAQEYYDENENDMFLNLTVGWNPGRDHTCTYDIIIYGDYLELETKPVPVDHLYTYKFTKLRSNSEYSIAIRGVNSNNESIHSQEVWQRYSYTNEIQAAAKVQHLSDDLYAINVTWNEPRYLPDYYQIQIRDRNANETSGIYEVELDGVSWTC